MKNKFFFWALWAGAVISANAAFVFFTLAGSDEAAAAWTLSFFCPLLRRCGGSYAETGQTRFRLRDVDAALSGDTAAGVYAAERRTAAAVGGCFFACRRYAVVYADFRYRQVKTGVASD